MTDRSNLPAKQRLERKAGPTGLENVVPGSWWRLTGQFNALEDRDAPEHGLVFLLSDVRIIDGEIHTVILHEHPLFGRGEFKVLLGDLLKEFTCDPGGEAYREQELAVLMSRINGITEELSNPPSDDVLLASLPAPDRDEGESSTAHVPSVLLPSGDVNAAQKKIETAIAVMEARKSWVEERTEDMKSQMGIVGQYQSEKVAVSLAGISEQRKWADKMLTNVQTMRLWLGDDQFFDRLIEGQGADHDEPLHFMQRMLFLDEEIYTHSRMDGLNGDDINDLSAFLQENPSLIDRMMPYQRCVVITKARRNTRPLDFSQGVTDILQAMSASEADHQIQILIRNGEQVYLVAADEITSRAKRLFPSRREIDAIFEESRFGGEARMITPQDIEYSDKRADHDSRALFYKRILLIIWGLAEREGIFGDFIGEGVNWLEETVHHKAFRFIHDEEFTLGDGKLSIKDFLSQNRSKARAKSRIMVQWDKLVDEDTADQLYDGSPYGTNRRYLKVDLQDDFGVCLVENKGDELIVKCPVKRHVYSSGRDMTYNSPVRISWSYSSWGRHKPHVTGGFICLDDLRSEELKYYFNSRNHREHYLEYLHLFNRAITFLEEEEAHCDPIAAEISDQIGVPLEAGHQAVRLWRSRSKWALPDAVSDLPKLLLLAERIRDIPTEITEDCLFVDLTASGVMEVGKLLKVDVLGFEASFVRLSSFSYKKRLGWVWTSDTVSDLDMVAGPSRLRLCCGISDEMMDRYHQLPPVLQSSQAVERLTFDGGVDTAGMSELLAMISDPESYDHKEMIDRCHQWSRKNSKDIVAKPCLRTVIGYAMDTEKHHRNLYRIDLVVDPIDLVLSQGGREHVWGMVRNLYKRYDTIMQDFDRKAEKLTKGDLSAVRLKMTRLNTASSVTEDPGFGQINMASWIGSGDNLEPGYRDKMLDPASLRERIILGQQAHLKSDEDCLRRANQIAVNFFPGGEELLNTISGLHALPLSCAEVDKEESQDCDPEI